MYAHQDNFPYCKQSMLPMLSSNNAFLTDNRFATKIMTQNFPISNYIRANFDFKLFGVFFTFSF